MRADKKRLLASFALAFFGLILGFWTVGMGESVEYTSSGIVDMRDPRAVSRAMDDPSFTATYSWGGGAFQLTGLYWAVAIPALFLVVGFVLPHLLHRIRRKKPQAGA